MIAQVHVQFAQILKHAHNVFNLLFFLTIAVLQFVHKDIIIQTKIVRFVSNYVLIAPLIQLIVKLV
jgi:hypothetical protein